MEDGLWSKYKLIFNCSFLVFIKRIGIDKNDYTASYKAQNLIVDQSLISKNVLYFVHWFELGGAESYALKTIEVANKLGASCYAISTVPTENKEISKFKVHCKEAFSFDEINAGNDFRSFVAEFIRSRKIDVIHIHHSHAMYEALPYITKIFPNLKVIDSTHIDEYGGGGFPYFSAKFSDFIDWHDVISKRLIGFITCKYQELYDLNINENKFKLSYLSSMCQIDNDFKRNASEKIRISLYSRLTHQKLPFLLEPIISLILQKDPDLQLEVNIYGEGVFEKKLQKQIKASKYSSSFNFHGRCDDKSIVFSNTDILFLPSLNEGITLTSYEALYHNVLPVSSAVGAQSELLSPDCLIELDGDFIKNAAIKLEALIKDKYKYDEALRACKTNLKEIEKNEFSENTILKLYG